MILVRLVFIKSAFKNSLWVKIPRIWAY